MINEHVVNLHAINHAQSLVFFVHLFLQQTGRGLYFLTWLVTSLLLLKAR